MIRVAIVGVGNCAAALIQGVYYYKQHPEAEYGLMHPIIGGHRVSDIEVVAAFDVSEAKVGKDLLEALRAPPNNLEGLNLQAPLGVEVLPGPLLDGMGENLRSITSISAKDRVNISEALRKAGAEIVICYLPVGSERAVRYYAREALEADCAFVNCIPVFLTKDIMVCDAYTKAGLPLLGDDIKSQLGATVVHRALARLFETRGVQLNRTYQLNFGGNADFYNLLEQSRLGSKKISKTEAVNSTLGTPLDPANIKIGPSDYVPWLGDRKIAYIRLEGTTFSGLPLNAELKLEVYDSPNSAGVVVDAVRCAKLALDRGIGGPLQDVCAYLMKSPPLPCSDDEMARQMIEEFIIG